MEAQLDLDSHTDLKLELDLEPNPESNFPHTDLVLEPDSNDTTLTFFLS